MRFFVTCARGTEGALRREIAALRIAGARGDRGGVTFEGPLSMGMMVCLHARTAVRVLAELGVFAAADAQALYAGARALPWHEWLTARSTFAVHASVRDTPALTHSGFVALKVKDALADALRDRLGARPDVVPGDPDVAVEVHVADGDARVYLDLAGEPLHRRGYRVAMTEAPLKETLAAAVLVLGGVADDAPFIDPLVGSGTFAIEQALRARHIAPGLGRRMGFERWPTLDAAAREAWGRLRDEARAAVRPSAPAPIVGADRDRESLAAARRNAAAAGVERDVTFEQADVRTLAPRWPTGTVCTNPPYGERLAAQRLQLEGFYRGLAERLRQMRGWRVVLLCGNPALEAEMRIEPAVSHRLWNGPIEVRLLRYDLPS